MEQVTVRLKLELTVCIKAWSMGIKLQGITPPYQPCLTPRPPMLQLQAACQNCDLCCNKPIQTYTDYGASG